jgi:hypothetical protein
MNKRGLFWGGALILLGLLFLLDTLGVFEFLGVSLWGLILPALLILIGIWLIWSIFARQKNPQSEQVTIPDDGIQRAELVINHGAGRLILSADPLQFNLLEGSFGGGVEHDTQRNAGTLKIKLTMVSDFFWKFPGIWGPQQSLDWNMRFKPTARYVFVLNTGASESRIDLTNLLVDSVSIKTGASSTDLALPQAAGFTTVKVRSGASSLSIKVPRNVAARIRATGGMMDMNIDKSRFPQSGVYHQSNDYDMADNKVDLEIETGVGSVKIW